MLVLGVNFKVITVMNLNLNLLNMKVSFIRKENVNLNLLNLHIRGSL